jgi:hypothetical protein
MSQNPKSKEVTKQAVLAELERLRQGRHPRYRTLLERFARCPDWQHAAALAAATEASACAYNAKPLDAPAGWLPPVSQWRKGALFCSRGSTVSHRSKG